MKPSFAALRLRLAIVWRTARHAAPVFVNDAIGAAGLGCVSYGAWLVYRPSGFIVGGILAVTTSVLRSARASKQ